MIKESCSVIGYKENRKNNKTKTKTFQRSLFPSLWNCLPLQFWTWTSCWEASVGDPPLDVLNTLPFKHAVSLGRSRACHKSKNHHHCLGATQLAEEAAFAHHLTLQTEDLQAGLVFVLSDSDCLKGWWWLPRAQLQIISFFPEAFAGKSLPPDLF